MCTKQTLHTQFRKEILYSDFEEFNLRLQLCFIIHDYNLTRMRKPYNKLTLILITWRIWWAPNNASKWQKGFNSAFKGLKGRVTSLNFNESYEFISKIYSRKCLRQTVWLWDIHINPLYAELNPNCHLLALLGAHHILHVSRVRVKILILEYQNMEWKWHENKNSSNK